MSKRKKLPKDARYQIRKRFFADCAKCSASHEAELYEDTQKYCSCGELLTWNDKENLKTLEGARICNIAIQKKSQNR